jgi:hypothetical protein
MTSPSGAIQAQADSTELVVTGRLPVRPLIIVFGVLPFVGIALYFLLPLGTSMLASALVGDGLLVYAAYLADSSSRSTTLRLSGEYADVTEARLFTTSRKHVRLLVGVDPAVESRNTETDEYINFLRLRVVGESHVDLLRGHSAQDVAWVWAAIIHWRAGGPHNMELHLTALARRR